MMFSVHSSVTDGAVKREEFYEALKIIPKEIFLYVTILTNTDIVLAIGSVDSVHVIYSTMLVHEHKLHAMIENYA